MIAALGDTRFATLAVYVPRVVGGDGAAWKELATRRHFGDERDG
jgi:hypothetical protein